MSISLLYPPVARSEGKTDSDVIVSSIINEYLQVTLIVAVHLGFRQRIRAQRYFKVVLLV
jgi:hypothetical protein